MIIEDQAARGPRVLRVLGALLGDSPEAALLRQAVRPPIALEKVESRTHVLAALREHRPDVVVFAVQDRDRLPTAPLVTECARARLGTRIVLLCAAPPPRGAAVLAAARAGARVLVAPTSAELLSILDRIARARALELALDCDALQIVQPPALRQLLCAAAVTIASDGRVDTLAQHLQLSTRTLGRYSRRTSAAPPKLVLAAVRLLWACALMESGSRDAGSVARTTGFSSLEAMRVASRLFLPPLATDSAVKALPSFRDALQQVVVVLDGHLAPEFTSRDAES